MTYFQSLTRIGMNKIIIINPFLDLFLALHVLLCTSISFVFIIPKQLMCLVKLATYLKM